MEKKKTGKLRILLLTGGVLLVCTAALVCAIVIAGNAEENKIIKTAYADKSIIEAKNDELQVTEEKAQLSNNIQISTETVSNKNDTLLTDGKLLTEDEAKVPFMKMYKMFFKSELSARHFEASLNTTSNIWLLGNKECIGYVEAKTGEVLAFYNVRGYLGECILTEDEFAEKKKELTENHDKYIKAATSFVKCNLDEDRNISEVQFDDVVFTGEPDESGTFLLTVRVLMKSGRSYCLGYTESPYNLERFFSYPSQEECIVGSALEDGPPLYPSEWNCSSLNPDSYEPQVKYWEEIGPEHITVDEAKEKMVDYLANLIQAEVDTTSLSAEFIKVNKGVENAYWCIYNQSFFCSIDAISGNLYSFEDNRPYKGPANSYNGKNEEHYIKAQEITEEFLANGNQIDHIFIDGVQTIFDEYNRPRTYLVDCHVIMKSGPSYTISLMGPYMRLLRIFEYDVE